VDGIRFWRAPDDRVIVHEMLQAGRADDLKRGSARHFALENNRRRFDACGLLARDGLEAAVGFGFEAQAKERCF
jgi:hypothetical protein